MTKVTIITPVYNNDQDILNAIQSVTNQTMTDWEMIIIDDCSTDKTYAVVSDFISKNTNFNLVLLQNAKNMGPYFSTNRAIQISTGEYICRLDSDDTIINNYFELNINFLDNNPHYQACQTKRTYYHKNPNYGEINLFYRRNTIDQIGYYDSVRFGADSEFIDRFKKKYGDKIHRIDIIGYLYKRRENSLTTSSTTGNRKSRDTYVKNYRRWHKTTKNLYVPFPLDKRLFPVDEIMKIPV